LTRSLLALLAFAISDFARQSKTCRLFKDGEAAMTANQTSPDSCRVFLYGTHLRPESEEPLWARKPDAIRPAVASGTLFDLGSVPAMRPGPGRVVGDLLEFKPRQMKAVLKALDALHASGAGGDGVYTRTVVEVEVDGAVCNAWTYLYPSQPPKRKQVTADNDNPVSWMDGKPGRPNPSRRRVKSAGSGEEPAETSQGGAAAVLDASPRPDGPETATTAPSAPASRPRREVKITSEERALGAMRTSTLIDAINTLQTQHPKEFGLAMRTLARFYRPRPLGPVGDAANPTPCRSETEAEAFERMFFSALPHPEMAGKIDRLFDFHTRIGVRSLPRHMHVRKVQAAALLIVLYLAIDEHAPRILKAKDLWFGRVPWKPVDSSGRIACCSRGSLGIPSWLDGPQICGGTMAYAIEAIRHLDARLADDLEDNPYRVPPPLTNSEMIVLIDLSREVEPVDGNTLAGRRDRKSYRVVFANLERLGYACRSSARGLWSITESGVERVRQELARKSER
jgi:gamma-glutamylcyclotransferase (GGCT)/AIG2-like uncharacterized protein YtfP